MKIFHSTIQLIVIIFIPIKIFAQDSISKPHPKAPIPVEAFFGNNRFVSQVSISHQFSENSRLGFIASSYIAADYKNNKQEIESVNVLFLSYKIIKGFGLVSGAVLNSNWGFRPYAGPQYFFANNCITTMLTSGFYLTESNNFETIGFAEYRPHLIKNWSLFSRIEGLYNWDMNTEKHDRSYLYSRLGFSYKSYSFGFAVNLDWYGPLKMEKENYGIFLRTNF